MEYFNIYDNHGEYLDEVNDNSTLVTPSVSLCSSNKHVHYEDIEYVDLGLSSGTLWAKCNIGAETETDFGKYFAWGEIVGYTYEDIKAGKRFFDEDSYKFGAYHDGTAPNMGITKYNYTNKAYCHNQLDAVDDAAFRNWGGEWIMPTKEDFDELMALSKQWTQINGVRGVKFYKSTNPSNYVFFPACGYAEFSIVQHRNSVGVYATSNLSGTSIEEYFLAVGISSSDSIAFYKKFERHNACSIRPIRKKYEYVDLDLPSGTLWATRNVGASAVTASGKYFQWGDTRGYYDASSHNFKSDFTDYKYSSLTSLTKYNTSNQYGIVDNRTILESTDDAAAVNMGGEWRMPTFKDCQELYKNTTHTSVTVSGVACTKYTSKTDSNKYILFPSAGHYEDGTKGGNLTIVWTNEKGTQRNATAFFNGNSGNFARSCGIPVRGVLKKDVTVIPLVNRSNYKVGDYLYKNGTVGTSANTSVVGVCVIPDKVLPDGKARFMSVKNITTANTSGSSSTATTVIWSQNSDNYTSQAHIYLGCVGKDEAEDAGEITNTVSHSVSGSLVTEGGGQRAYLPSDRFIDYDVLDNPFDTLVGYYYNDTDHHIASPYLYNNKYGYQGFNMNYCAPSTLCGSTSNIVSVSIDNALSDFDGEGNTADICEYGETDGAAMNCSMFNPGYGDGMWYLPAVGELGFIMPRLSVISAAIKTLIENVSSGSAAPIINKSFWSSTEFIHNNSGGYSEHAWIVDTVAGFVGAAAKNGSHLVRAFIKI